MQRTIIFGDIHGCLSEWKALLDRIGPSSSDRLVAAGDVICKGPYPAKTMDFARGLKNLTCLLGNHELSFLRYWHDGERPASMERSCEAEAARRMGRRFDDHMRAVASWPHYLDLPEALIVHAGLKPGVPLWRQDLEDLTQIRMAGRRPWYESYQGKKLAVFGHWVHREPIWTETAVGLDTGCVYGGKLSALILPERRIVQVRARRAYVERKGTWSW